MNNLAVYNKAHRTLTLSRFSEGNYIPTQEYNDNINYLGTETTSDGIIIHKFKSEDERNLIGIPETGFKVIIQEN